MAGWAGGHGAAYLDGAAMSGTRLVGRPEALFVFSGSLHAFATHRTVLARLGNSVHLGADPALAPVYDTALFGMAWGALAGFTTPSRWWARQASTRRPSRRWRRNTCRSSPR
ncbi:hypothetical protein GCM10009837_67090 [Streptomyces durmitorensis]